MRKKFLLLFLALIATTFVWAEDYITDVMVIGGSKSETNALKTTYTNQGWTVINQDLNAGASGDYIFLLYKKAIETASGVSFITDFYISSVSGTAPDEIEHNGLTYHIAPCDGSDYFKSSKGDLNCHCSGSAYIHLYYTKEYPDNGQDYSTVKSISFNSTQAGAVGENGGTTGYDLNAGAGGDYIYMHIGKSQGWTITNSAGTQCYINGFDGPKAPITSITIPTTLGGAQVAGFTGTVFSGFTNLETMTFNENTIISQMPSLQGCSKFKHVRTGTVNDQTPPSITNIPASAFAGTAIETINMPSATNVGEHAFEGSGLNQIALHSCLMEIGSYAFHNCNSLTDIYFDGNQQQWGNVTKGTNWKPDAAKEHWHCTVTFDANGHGTAPASQNIEWSNQDKATEPTITAFGYKCLGWYTEAACTNQWDFNTVVPGDMTLYAKWEETQYGFNSETGELVLLWGEFNKGNKWGSDVPVQSVKSVTANSGVSFTGDCSQLFQFFSNCTSMDLHNVNTSNVTKMFYMFQNCKSLTLLDLSGWDTGNVTDMSYMFSSCESLSSLNLSGWNTSNVTSMYAMFYRCFNLSSLDITSFNTSNATSMGFMFDLCQSLTALDLAGFNTSNVTDMHDMFSNCESLTTIYVGSGWSTANVTMSSNMFIHSTALKGGRGTTYDENHVDKEYARIDHGAEEPGYLTGMFTLNLPEGVTVTPAAALTHGDVSYYAAGTLIALHYNGLPPRFIVNGELIEGYIFKMPYSDVEVTLLPTYTFNSETGELTLNWGEFNRYDNWGDDVPAQSVMSVTATSDVSFTDNCSELFQNFSNCMSMDLSKVNTTKVINMSFMFENCSSLTSLDISKWNTSRVTDMRNMFRGCTSLATIYAGSRWSTEKVTISNDMFKDCVALVGGMGTTYNGNHIDKEYARIDKGASEPGYFARVARYTYDSETGELKLNWGEFNKDNKWGDDVPSFDVKSVVATSEVSFTGDCSFLFRAFGCERMDLSNVNTSDVTNMNNMFLSCALLTSLDISGWDTEHVTDMNRMFFDCWKLPSLNLSGWNTRNVTNMDYMFCNCMNLNTIYVSPEWNTENVVNSFDMFDDCTSLVGGMGTTFDANHIDKEYARIDGGPECPGYFTMGSRYIFNSDTGELKLIWGEFNNGDVWGSDVDPSAVRSVSATSHVSFTGNCLQMFLNFSNCESMDLSKVNTGNATNMSFMFHNCNSLTSLDLSNWDTGNVTNMRGMFANCTHLPMLDISSFNTGNITDMSYMFSGCNNLTTIDAGAMWSTENVTNSSYMFNGCISLVGGMGTTYSYSHIDKEYARIDGGPECPGYFTATPQGVPGDVNGDGAVTSADVTELYNHLLNGDMTYIATGDVNGDGTITSADITAVYSILLGN